MISSRYCGIPRLQQRDGPFEYNLGGSEVLTIWLSVIACGYVVIRQLIEASADPVHRRNVAEERTCGSSLIVA
jgi:hypothetical protein